MAGLPWTLQRARQHIVNEVTQALQKFLVFNSQHTTPFHKWTQGRWYSTWSNTSEGEHICTLYISIDVPESKIKIRKGKNFGWHPIPNIIQALLQEHPTEDIWDA
jgi:exonuclease III